MLFNILLLITSTYSYNKNFFLFPRFTITKSKLNLYQNQYSYNPKEYKLYYGVNNFTRIIKFPPFNSTNITTYIVRNGYDERYNSSYDNSREVQDNYNNLQKKNLLDILKSDKFSNFQKLQYLLDFKYLISSSDISPASIKNAGLFDEFNSDNF